MTTLLTLLYPLTFPIFPHKHKLVSQIKKENKILLLKNIPNKREKWMLQLQEAATSAQTANHTVMLPLYILCLSFSFFVL